MRRAHSQVPGEAQADCDRRPFCGVSREKLGRFSAKPAVRLARPKKNAALGLKTFFPILEKRFHRSDKFAATTKSNRHMLPLLPDGRLSASLTTALAFPVAQAQVGLARNFEPVAPFRQRPKAGDKKPPSMWKHGVLSAAIVAVIWLSSSLVTTTYLHWLEGSYEKSLQNHLSCIDAADAIRQDAWRLYAVRDSGPSKQQARSEIRNSDRVQPATTSLGRDDAR